MEEPGEVLDVIDAFDDDVGDDFDISISLGFEYYAKMARILRESSVFEGGLTTGGYTSKNMAVAKYTETTSKLIPQLDIGIYKDLALYFRAPIILNNARKLEGLEGSEGALPVVLEGTPGEVLFNLPFESPGRSGVEYLAPGINWAIFNQARDHTKPTWVVGGEVRFSVGEPMHACNPDAPDGQLECADPGDIDRDGEYDDTNLSPEGTPLETVNPNNDRGAGVSRGTVGFELHTLMSKRLKYIEPYGGFSALVEVQQGESDYDASDLEGTLVNHPPLVGTVSVGMMIHPWENREKFGRLTINLRFDGEYHSEGRDYTELFDALGSSTDSTLRSPKWAAYERNPSCQDPSGDNCSISVVDQGSQKTYFTGLSLVEAYGSYRARASITWQASEYVKLTTGMGLRFDQAHGISHEQPCNPDFKGDIYKSGPCHSENWTSSRATGIPNAAYRPVINAVGRRFYVDESKTFEIFARGVVMF